MSSPRTISSRLRALLLSAGILLVGAAPVSAQIWINPLTTGNLGTRYLGDTMGNYYLNFEIGQTTWNRSRVGIGTSTANANAYNFADATFYENGSGNNRRVRRNLNGYQFTTTGNHYILYQARAGAGDSYTQKSSHGWANSTGWPGADGLTTYFDVQSLGNPTGVSATAAGTSQINLAHTRWSGRSVLIARRAGSAVTWNPTQGTTYTDGQSVDSETTTVVRRSLGADSFNDTGLNSGTTYHYKIYSENFSYYSSGVTASASTSSATPSITINNSTSATATAFTTTYGTASSTQSFTIAGANLTANISVGAVTGFEYSIDNGSTWGTTRTITRSGSTASATLLVRLAATATVAGTYNSQNIPLTSTDATTRNITTASSGNAVSRKGLGITVANQSVKFGFPATGGTSVVASGSYSVAAGDLANGESASVVTGTASYSTTYVQGDAAGTAGRTISVSGLTAANYTLNVTNGTVTVTTLQNPTATATATGRTTINVVTTNVDWVMIVRHTADSWTAPSQGTSYTAGTSSIGSGAVRYIGPAGTFEDTGLTPGTQYFYKVYTEYFSRYSTGAATTSATPELNHVYNITSGSTTVSDNLTGATSALVKSGAGTLVLTGNNSYGGKTTNSAGTILINSDGRLGTAPNSPVADSITIGNATLGMNGTITLNANRGITLTGNATLDDWGDNDTYNGIIVSSGTTSLTKLGSAILSLGGSNSYTGTTTVSAGALAITHANALGATGANNGTVVSDGRALRLSGDIAVGNELLTISGVGIDTTGALRNTANDNSWSGAITLAANARIMSDSGTLTLTGGINVGANNTLYVGGAGNHAYSGTWSNAGKTSGDGALYKDGAGALTLSGTHSGLGVVRLVNGGITIASGATFSAGDVFISLNRNLTVNENITVTGLREAGTGDGGTASIASGKTITVNLGSNKAEFFMNSMSGAGGGLTINGSGTSRMSLYGTQSYTGSTTINGGTLGLQDGAVLSTTNLIINAGATLNIDRRTSALALGAQTLSGPNAAGTGTIAAGSDDGLTLGATTTLNLPYFVTGTAPLTISGGNLNLNSATAVTVNNNGSALAAGNHKIIAKSGAGAVAGSAPSSVTVNGGGILSGGSASLSIIDGELFVVVAALPVVTASTFNGTVGTAFSQSISATESPTSYAISSGTLPAGLSFNTSTGAITGTPTTAASGTTIQVTATNAAGTSSAATITFNIAKGTPTITTAPTASAITFGQTLASSTLSNGVGSVAGAFTFTTSSTAPNAGTAAQSVTFTPTDTANYETITTTVNVTVNAASLPTVTFTPPASLEYNRTAKTYTASASGVTLTLTYTGRNSTSYGPSTTAPTNVGDYTVTASTSNTNYTGSQAQDFSITQKALTITGASATNRAYNATTTVAITGGSLVGVETGDTANVTLSAASATGTVATAAVGDGKAVTVTGYSISGSASGNYSLTQPTGLTVNITQKALTITGASATNRAYNATTTVAITGGSLVGVETADTSNVTLGGSPTGTVESAAVGNSKAVTVTGFSISGSASSNYSLTQPTGLTVDITAKGITGSFTASNKEYDGNATATVTGLSLTGVETGDTVTLEGGTATFSDANAGEGKTVTLTGASLDGAAAGNYNLTSVSTTTADITAKALTGTFTAENKVYDGSNTATVASRDVTGKVGSDDVNHTGGTATFDTATVGNGKTVTLTGATLTGTAAGNYTLGSVSTTTANITKATPSLTTAPTASAITLGQTLASSTLSGGAASVAGTFAFTSPGTQPAEVGTATQDVTFTPTDTTNYNTIALNVSVTVNAASDPLPTENVTFVEQADGSYVVRFNGEVLPDTTFTYSYAGRDPTGLDHTYEFLDYSGSTAPTAPGFYTVTAMASGAYSGTTAPADIYVTGPLALPGSLRIEVNKIAGSTTVRFNRSQLLGTLQRVTAGGTLATGPTGLSWTGITAGESAMPAGHAHVTMANTVTHSASFVTLTPPDSGASDSDSFTMTVSDGATAVEFGVTAISTAAPPFDLQIRRKTPMEGSTNDVAIFLTRPNRTIEMEFKSSLQDDFQPVRNTAHLVSTDSQNLFMEGEGQQHIPRPAAAINTGSTGVIQLIVPRNGSMFFQARPVAPAP